MQIELLKCGMEESVMTSISARCFLKNNKKQICVLGFLFMITAMCYFGQIFIADGEADFLFILEKSYQDTTLLYPDDNCTEKEWAQLLKELEQENAEYIQVGLWMSYGWDTVLSFRNNVSTYAFASVEDLKTFNKYTKIVPGEIQMKQDGIIVNELCAKNIGIQKGQKVTSEDKYLSLQNREYKVQETFESDGYFLFVVDKDYAPDGLLLFGLDEKEQKKLEEKYDTVTFQTKTQLMDEIAEQFEVVNYIFYLVVLMLAVVLSITVYACFKGVWDKRKFEFSLYKALGFSNRQIIWKNIKEILAIAACGSGAGAVVILTVMYIMNHTVWLERGLQLTYFSVTGLEITLLCDVLILLPFVISQIRTVRRLDITEY